MANVQIDTIYRIHSNTDETCLEVQPRSEEPDQIGLSLCDGDGAAGDPVYIEVDQVEALIEALRKTVTAMKGTP